MSFNMPEGYVPGEKPWHPNSEAYDGAECRSCGDVIYSGQLNEYGDCPDCNGGEAA